MLQSNLSALFNRHVLLLVSTCYMQGMSFEILRKVESQMFDAWVEEKLGKDMIGKDAIFKDICLWSTVH